jgi:hypothetical protein
MDSKFTYFDFIAYIVPGTLLLGILSLVFNSKVVFTISDNTAIDTLLFLVISFVLGGLIHQASRYLVEPIVKHLFWKGKAYSEIYLVKKHGICRNPVRIQILANAAALFQFDKNSLDSLDCDSVSAGSPDPYIVSHQIFRRFDHFTLDHGLAKKGHTANALYSLYRTMTLTILIVGILFAASFHWNTPMLNSVAKAILTVSSFLGVILFLMRTRNEGQRYVEGVLQAIPNEKILTEGKSGDQSL